MAKTPRQWSRANTPQTERSVHINIAKVPPTLRDTFARKCRVANLSQRALLLGWIRNWIAGRRPDEAADTVRAPKGKYIPLATLVDIAAGLRELNLPAAAEFVELTRRGFEAKAVDFKG